MQSGRGKTKQWILKFDSRHGNTNPLMGWETSNDTMSEVVLKFPTREKAIEYAKKNKIWLLSQKNQILLLSHMQIIF